MTRTKLLITGVLAAALLALPGTALARDRDHDGMPDRWEKKNHLNPNKRNARKDPDHDGLSNIREFRLKTVPRDADSDNDGLNDGNEVELGDNPRDADTDNDGVEDGDEIAGTVQSFDSGTGLLTILLADGTTTRSGTVTSSTRIECENHAAAVSAARHGSDDGPNHDAGDDRGGDNSGPGSSGDNSGPGSSGDNSGPGRDGDDRAQCTTADLTPGRVVHEAELFTNATGDAVFEKVKLDG